MLVEDGKCRAGAFYRAALCVRFEKRGSSFETCNNPRGLSQSLQDVVAFGLLKRFRSGRNAAVNVHCIVKRRPMEASYASAMRPNAYQIEVERGCASLGSDVNRRCLLRTA